MQQLSKVWCYVKDLRCLEIMIWAGKYVELENGGTTVDEWTSKLEGVSRCKIR